MLYQLKKNNSLLFPGETESYLFVPFAYEFPRCVTGYKEKEEEEEEIGDDVMGCRIRAT